MRLAVLLLLTATAVAQDKPRLVPQVGHTGRGEEWTPVRSVAFSPDERLVLTGGGDGAVRLWDKDTGRLLQTLLGHSGDLARVAFLPGGKRVVSVAGKTVRVWDLKSSRPSRTFELEGSAWGAAVSGDGRLLGVTGHQGGLWRLRDGKRVAGIPAKNGPIAISPDGDRVAFGDGKGSVLLTDAKGRPKGKLTGHTEYLLAIAFSPDGRHVLTGSNDKTARLWDTETANEIRRADFGDGAYRVRFSPDGAKYLVLTYSKLKIFDTESGAVLRSLPKPLARVADVVFSSDGRSFLVGGQDAVIWDLAANREVQRFAGLAISRHPEFSADEGSIYFRAGGFLHEWDLERGAYGGRVVPDDTGSEGAWFSGDGRLLATSRGFKDVSIRDLASRKVLRTIHHPGANYFWPIGLSADGARVALIALKESTGQGANRKPGKKILIVEETKTANEIFRVEAPESAVFNLFAPDGKSLYCDGVLWDVESGEKRHQFPDGCNPTAFSSDGKLVVIGGRYARTHSLERGVVTLWDVRTGRMVREFDSETSGIRDVEISPNRQLLAAACDDGNIRIWRAATGKLLHRLDGRYANRSWIGFSRDSLRLVSAEGGTIRLWDVRKGKELCTLVAFGDGSWAAVDAEGRFDASNGGDVEGLHWVYRNEPISLDQLKERYYEPGLLAKIFGFNKEPLRKVKAFRLPKLYPMTTLQPPTEKTQSLKIKLKNRGGGIGRVVVRVNGKELTDDARGDKANPKARSMQIEVPLDDDPRLLPGEMNLLEVEVYNAAGYLRSRGMRTSFKAPGKKEAAPPRLHAIVVGTADYAGEAIDLRYASKDAADFAGALTVAASGLLGPKRVSVALLRDATRPELVKALKGARGKLKARDILVLYLAGHGVNVSGDDGDFFYLTKEASSAQLADPEVRKRVGISSRELTNLLKRIPALKQVLVLDTCAAGGFIDKLTEKRNVPSSQIRALERLKDRTGLHILAGCASDRVSYEATRYAQGLLTHSLLLGMRGGALREDEYVDVLRLFSFAVDQVPELAGSIGGIQRPLIASPRASASFDIGRLDDETKEQVPLRTPRPLVLRSNFQDEEELEDVLSLAKHVDRYLNDASARGEKARLVFVDARALPDACRIAGRYRVVDEKIEVDLRLSRGKEKLARFTMTGKTSELDVLAERIVEEVSENLR